MYLNQTMKKLFVDIQQAEPTSNLYLLDLSSSELGNNLIRLYTATRSQKTRELITLFMREAGYFWLTKLVTRNVDEVVEEHKIRLNQQAAQSVVAGSLCG